MYLVRHMRGRASELGLTGASKLPKSFLSGNPSKMLVICQYKFLTRLIVSVHVIC